MAVKTKERRTVLRFAATVVVYIWCSQFGTPIAAADAWGTDTTDTGQHPDGSWHSYCWGSGFDSTLQDNASFAESDSLGGPTEATVQYFSTCNLSGSGETDVVWLDDNLPGDTRGETYCEDYDGDYCDQSYLTLDPAEINEGSNDEADTTKTACHELGHTVGLTHNNTTDCMIGGERPSLSTIYETYTAHHKWHINVWFEEV